MFHKIVDRIISIERAQGSRFHWYLSWQNPTLYESSEEDDFHNGWLLKEYDSTDWSYMDMNFEHFNPEDLTHFSPQQNLELNSDDGYITADWSYSNFDFGPQALTPTWNHLTDVLHE